MTYDFIKFISVVGVKDEAAFNVALVELSGHLPIKSKFLLKISSESVLFIRDVMSCGAMNEVVKSIWC